MGDIVKVAVELLLSDRFGVYPADFHLILPHLLPAFADGPSQHINRCRFPGEWVAHNHKPVPNQDHIVDLDDLVQDVLVEGQVELGVLLGDFLYEMGVVDFWRADVREEIAGDAREEGDIEGQELGNVDIIDCL